MHRSNCAAREIEIEHTFTSELYVWTIFYVPINIAHYAPQASAIMRARAQLETLVFARDTSRARPHPSVCPRDSVHMQHTCTVRLARRKRAYRIDFLDLSARASCGIVYGKRNA